MDKLEFRNSNYASIFYIVLLAGYILISGLPYVFSVDSRTITIPFRALVLGMSMILIGYNFYLSRDLKFDKSDCFFILFWIVYFINVYFSFRNYDFSKEFRLKESEIYLRIIGVVFLPSLAILTLNPKKINYRLVFNSVYIIIFIILLLNIIKGIDYNYQGRSSGFLSMYSINFGHVGVTLAILSLYNLMFNAKKTKYINLLMGLGFLIGTYILYSSGTRGPLVAYIVTISYMLYVKKKYYSLSALYLIMAVGIMGLVFLNLKYENIGENGFFARVTNMVVSGDSSGRGKIYKDSIHVILENPFFGGRFVFFDGMYVHNVFLDILMATGLLGMIIFLMFFKNCIKEMIHLKQTVLIKTNVIWIHLLFIQYITFAFFSCSLFDTPEFWYLTAMIMVLYKSQKNKKECTKHC
jgi:O-antigen ligase